MEPLNRLTSGIPQLNEAPKLFTMPSHNLMKPLNCVPSPNLIKLKPLNYLGTIPQLNETLNLFAIVYPPTY